jgi:glycosyltransferase involved in cell wall biosynthesis
MKILYVHNHLASFVQLDLEILQSRFAVTGLAVLSRAPNPAAIYRLVRDHDLLFGWFASWHTFFPVLFARRLSKPSLLVTGGYDLAKLPEAAYGNQRSGIRRIITNRALQMTTQLVTNSCFSRDEAIRHAGIPREKIRVIYHGVPDRAGSSPEKKAPPVITTVGNIEKDNLLRKGHLPFAQAAALLPEHRFILVGKDRDGSANLLKNIAPANLQVTGWLSQEALQENYARAWVYVQPSLHEAFGLSVAEAMLAGCIPVVSCRGALPEVVGDAGLILPSTEAGEVARGIQQALPASPADRMRARQRILDEFPLEKRRKALIELCLELFSAQVSHSTALDT